MNSTSRIRRGRLAGALTCAACCTLVLLSPLACAQNTAADSLEKKLSTRVRLQAGESTLGEVLAALSRASGAKVTAADYLRDRIVMVALDGVTLRAALDALTEVNDWSWSEATDHAIIVERRPLPLQNSPGAIARKIKAAIPDDIRAYLGVARPSAKLEDYSNPLTDGTRAAMHRDADIKLLRLLKSTQASLFGSLPPNSVKGDPIAWSSLTAEQKRNLIIQMTFPLLRELNTDNLLVSDVLPYVWDPTTAVIEPYNGYLMVRTYTLQNGRKVSAGFGAKIGH